MTESTFRLFIAVTVLLGTASGCYYVFVFQSRERITGAEESGAKSIRIIDELKTCLSNADTAEEALWRDACKKLDQDDLGSCNLSVSTTALFDRERESDRQLCYKQADLQTSLERQ